MKSRKEIARSRKDNVKLTLRGITRLLPEWAEILGIKAGTIHMRLKRGYSDEDALTKGKIPINRSRESNPNYRHGHAVGAKVTPTYESWSGLVGRCTNPDNESWPDYGGRGITVCERWLSFPNFLEDMGAKPKGKRWSIGRKDNNGNYCPENCRWEQDIEQARNRRNNRILTLDNKSHCVAEWAEILGIPLTTLYLRISYGWTDEKVLTTPHRGWGPGKPRTK